jgi:serine/threonine-protein kinase
MSSGSDARVSDAQGSEPVSAGPEPAASLAALLHAKGVLDPDTVRSVFDQVLDQLRDLHASNQVHGDISSDRIIVRDGRYILTGAGAGRLGSVRYMAPERCQAKPADARSDVYSVGVVLYQALTGRVPFDSDLRHEVMEAHISRPPDPPRLSNPAITPELERVVLRALSKNPAGRYQTAVDLRSALDAAIGGELPQETPRRVPESPMPEAGPVSVQPSKAGMRLRPWALIVPAVLAVAAAAVLFYPRARSMPALEGKAQAWADSALSRLAVRNVVVENVADASPAGTVVRQSPARGSRVSRRTEVVLSVSTGVPLVPDLAGLSQDSATAQLKLLGAASVVESTFSDAQPAGTVVGTRPAEGESLAAGQRVAIIVSQGRASCPKCGTPRERGARFCTRCGFRY